MYTPRAGITNGFEPVTWMLEYGRAASGGHPPPPVSFHLNP